MRRCSRVVVLAVLAAMIVAPAPAATVDLDALTARISDDLPSLSGLGISLIAPEPANERVLIVAGRPQAEAVLTARYGAHVSVRVDDPARFLAGPPCAAGRTACPPVMRGGLELIGALTAICSSGVEARLNQTGEIGVITAGHCYANAEPVTHAGIVLGPAGPRSFGGEADAAFVTHSLIAPTFLPSNWIYASNSDIEHAITSVQPIATEAAGQSVCRAGRTTSLRCGTITHVNATVVASGVTLRNQRVTNICALPGDSGGPVYSGGTFRGIVSAGNFVTVNGVNQCHSAPFSTYSAAERIQSALGVRVLTSSPLL